MQYTHFLLSFSLARPLVIPSRYFINSFPWAENRAGRTPRTLSMAQFRLSVAAGWSFLTGFKNVPLPPCYLINRHVERNIRSCDPEKGAKIKEYFHVESRHLANVNTWNVYRSHVRLPGEVRINREERVRSGS